MWSAVPCLARGLVVGVARGVARVDVVGGAMGVARVGVVGGAMGVAKVDVVRLTHCSDAVSQGHSGCVLYLKWVCPYRWHVHCKHNVCLC